MARLRPIEFNVTVTVESLGRYTTLLKGLYVSTVEAIQLNRVWRRLVEISTGSFARFSTNGPGGQFNKKRL